MSLNEFLFNFKLLIEHLQEKVNTTTLTIIYNKYLLFYSTPSFQQCIFFLNKTEYNEKVAEKKLLFINIFLCVSYNDIATH